MPVNTERRVKLTISTQTLYTKNVTQNYRVTVVASNANLMPNEIFLFSRKPGGVDIFKGVCTPSQLQFLPIDNPDTNVDPTFFRKSSIDWSLEDSAAAEAFSTSLLTAVGTLKASLDTADGLQSTTFWIGTAPLS